MSRKVIKNRSLSEFIEYLQKIEQSYMKQSGCLPYVWSMNDEEIELCSEIVKTKTGSLQTKKTEVFSLKKFKFIW